MVPSTQDLPFVSCICPTFHRPKLLRNALACFLAQDYPGRHELIIMDDGNDFPDFEATYNSSDVRMISRPSRCGSLPEKFNELLAVSRGEIVVVWEDDDIYLSHHLSAHVEAILKAASIDRAFSKPSQVLSTYPGHVVAEDAAGRFHASIAFSREMVQHGEGWIDTKRADFDQLFMSHLSSKVDYKIVDSCQFAPPSYCFRYGSTQAYHGQHFMRSPEDETWYDRVPSKPGNRDQWLYPEFDQETMLVYSNYSAAELATV